MLGSPAIAWSAGVHRHEREDDDVVLPMFNLKGVSKSADDMYRSMEKGAEFSSACRGR